MIEQQVSRISRLYLRTSVSIVAQDLPTCGIIDGLKEKRFDRYEASKRDAD
jgi:hypothetical protein